MLIDDVLIKIEAGNGGKGAVAFNKNKMTLGPVGGRGGKGGSVYIEGVSNLNALSQFRYKKDIKAENGKDGRGQLNDGTKGEDLILKVPVGTVLHTINISNLAHAQEILKIGERVLIAQGGIGGKGNFLFRSATNTSPTQSQKGMPGERITLRLELKLIADVGIIGLPNAGKSSLLNELTKAQSKVGNYPFTTLEPNLGVYYELILADIPGLVVGASTGKGLGTKFLRHIERTNILFHLISAESEDPVQDYLIIQKELGTYSKELLKKTEYVFLTKSDLVPAQELEKKIAALKKIHKDVLAISIHDWESLEKVNKILNEIKIRKSDILHT